MFPFTKYWGKHSQSHARANVSHRISWYQNEILKIYAIIIAVFNTVLRLALASTLKELIADDIVHKEQFNEIPPRVEYCLTDKGHSVVPILQTICKWSGAYHKEDNENTFL